jgi:nucleoside-diphosphate-sugar epimerase
VYGIKQEAEVTEDLPGEPLTDYSKYKLMCERVLQEEREHGFVTCTLRPATVCGYAPRQRLDVVVNILTNHAVNTGRIKVLGGSQKRPNIHIDDMSDLYLFLLQQPDEKIDGKTWNAGFENHTLMQLADIVKSVVGGKLAVDVQPTDDLRSYHVSSERMRCELGFVPRHTIEDAVKGLVEAMKAGRLPRSMEDSRYFNIKRMQEIELK